MLPITLRCHAVVLSLRNQIVEWLDSLIVKSDFRTLLTLIASH